MANAHFVRQLQRLSMPILAVSACNGSPELASLLSLRAALVFVLKTSRFYARLLPAIAAEAGKELDEEIERMAREGRVDLLGHLRRPLMPSSSRPSQACAAMSRQRTGGVGFREVGHDSWTLCRLSWPWCISCSPILRDSQCSM
jgi:hypothetical protein